jgi:anaphase-promoting complex subunit 6
LVETQQAPQLFYAAHQLVRAYPKDAVAWFAVAAYYYLGKQAHHIRWQAIFFITLLNNVGLYTHSHTYLVGRFDAARRHFGKCTSLDRSFAGGWLGFGHAFAALDESDQAMAAYRTAARLFRGSHVSVLCFIVFF